MFQRIRGGSLILQADTILQVSCCADAPAANRTKAERSTSLFTIRNYKLKLKKHPDAPLGSDE